MSFDLVLFGGTGDLAWRKLMPALFQAFRHGSLPSSGRIIGVARDDLSDDAYRAFIKARFDEVELDKRPSQEEFARFAAMLNYLRLDVTKPADFARLAEMIKARQADTVVMYVATAPGLFTSVDEQIAAAGLNGPTTRVVLEKPLGHDLASNRAINEAVGQVFKEQQIFRIDHYLGKPAVQNLFAMRFGNALFEPLWRREHIANIQITMSEELGVEKRGGFYDATGAMRDMVQNHLLQLLCIVAMEPPISMDANDVRDEKLKVLRSLRKMDLADIKRDTVRGQYISGNSEGLAAKGYREEANVPPDSRTETFVALKAHVNNARWANVPFFLRTGKRLQKWHSEIIIEFSEQPFSIFGHAAQQPNRLIISLQPEESIQLQMMVKEPGSGMNMSPVNLGLELQLSSDKRRAEAYERLLMDVIKGRLTHFMRRDELEAAWTWVEPILHGWETLDEKPREYPAGSWGPAASSALMARENLCWFEEN